MLRLPKPVKAPKGSACGRIRRRTPPSPVRRTDRAALEREADRLFSQLVRAAANHRCEKCGRGAHDAAHVLPREHRGVRWSHANAFALCRVCHQAFGNSPAWKEWTVSRLGTPVLMVVALEAQRVERSGGLTLVHMEEVVEGLREGLCVQGERDNPAPTYGARKAA